MRSIPIHIQPYARFLPLRWTRLSLSVAIIAVLIVAGYFDTWFFVREHRHRERIRGLFPSTHKVIVDDSTLVHLGIPCLLSLAILGSTASNPMIFLLQDIYLLLKPSYIPGLSNSLARLHSRLRFSEQRIRGIQLHLMEKRISQTTYMMQIVSMLLPMIVMIGVLIPFTVIARMGSASVSVIMEGGGELSSADVMQVLVSNGIDLKYWDSFFVRESAIASWVVIGLAILLILTTARAWMLSRYIPSDVFLLPTTPEKDLDTDVSQSHGSQEKIGEAILPLP